MNKPTYALMGIIVLAILVAVLFPVFHHPRPQPHILCIRNEKQIGLAIAQYVEDYDEHYPPISTANGHQTWRNALYPYIKSTSLYQCPDQIGAPVGPDGLPNSYMGNYSGKINPYAGEGLFSSPGEDGVAMADIPSPDQLIAICDGTGIGPAITVGAAQTDPNGPVISARHHGQTNFLFADGHAKALFPEYTAAATETANGSQVWQHTVNLWYRDSNIPLSPAGQLLLKTAQDSAQGKE